MKKIRFRMACSTNEGAGPLSPIPLTADPYSNLVTAHRLGYDGIEIHARENAPFDFRRIRDYCADNGMGISALVTGKLCTEGGLTLAGRDPAVCAAAEKGMLEYIDAAEKLRTDLVIGWVRGRIEAGDSAERYYDALAGVMRRLSAAAADKNVRLFFEVINRYELNTFNNAAQMMDFIGKYGLENVYAHLDTFHMNIEESDMAAAMRSCGDKLAYIHFADNTRRYPGSGDLDFNKIVAAIGDIGYDGFISVECLPWPTGEEAARRALKTVREAIRAYEAKSPETA